MHIAEVLVPALQGQFPAARVGVTLPASLTGIAQHVQVLGVGGGVDKMLTRGTASVICTVPNSPEAPGHQAAMDLSSAVHQFLMYRCRGVFGPGVISAVKAQSLPQDLHYNNTDVLRYGGIYAVYCHPSLILQES